MPKRPRHPRPDGNQADIFQQARELGFIVHNTSPLGGEVLDGFIGGYDLDGRWCWLQVEVKQPGEHLTAGEAAYFEMLKEKMRGFEAEAAIIAESIDNVLDWFGRTQ